jgi:hypothetical protein
MIISELNDYLRRNSRNACTFDQIDHILRKYKCPEDSLRKSLENHSIFYIERQRIFKRKKYDISNKLELKKLLSSKKEGIEQNNDLFDCYRDCFKDVETLKKEKEIRNLENKTEKKTFLYGIDEKYDKDLNLQGGNLLKEKWKKILEDEYLKTERKFENKNKKIKKSSHKRKRKRINITNEWMTDWINFEEEIGKLNY